jgi:DNA replication and repair protein RecF
MISSIRLQNFRSYTDESFEFEPGVNIIVGPNASGKTNLLEAVLVLARGSSYRAKDSELVEFNKPWARLDSYFEKQSRVLKIEEKNAKFEKSYEIDDKVYKRLSFDKTIPVVYFEPNHLQFITRGPDQRRDFIDDLLERSEPGFKTLLSNYRRVLAQRNSLLKHDPKFVKAQLFAWNVRLSELGTKIAEARNNLIDEINIGISATYSKISRKESKVEMFYDLQFPIEQYASKLLNKQQSSQTASRGETRSLVLALKIFELELIEKSRGKKPIFLLDDVFSELDGARRHALVEYLKNNQTIITTTDADAIIEHFTDASRIIPLS